MAPFNGLSPRAPDLCTTPDCIRVASDILGNMDLNYTEIDPCTDFDKFSCGNWAARHPLSIQNGGATVLDAIQQDIFSTERQIIQGAYPAGSDSGWISVNLTDDQVKADKENFEKLQDAYQTCINYTTLAAEGLEPLAEFIKTVVELFPVAKSTNQTKYNHSDAMGKTLVFFESLGIQTTQFFGINPNSYNRSENVLNINPIVPNKIAINGGLEYIELVSALISAVHPGNVTEKQAQTLLGAALELEVGLSVTSQSSQAEAAAQGETVLQASLSEIHKIAPQFNYEYVVRQLAPKGYKADVIQSAHMSYYKNASDIISETPAEVLQTFFVWKAVSALSNYIESPLTNALVAFPSDPKSLAQRWKTCVRFVDQGVTWLPDLGMGPGVGTFGPSGLTWIIARFYAERKYSSEAHEQMNEIADYLEKAFIERVDDVDWASSKVKKASTEKVRAIDKRIALPTDPDAFDPIETKEYYTGVDITNSHFDNALSLAKSHVKKQWDVLGEPYRKGWFLISGLTANAYYEPVWNTITMLLGFLEFPNYSVGMPSYITYGGLGSVVGHEITHGFDTSGRLYDKNGNMTKWWDDKSINAYNEKTECFVEQYSNYTLTASDGTKVPIDGNLTLTENIADAGGLVSSYVAWKNWETEKGSSKNLPGLEKFTHEQLFFLKWGQTWCHAISDDDWISGFTTDKHSPNDARIKVALTNSEAFLEAFKCPSKKPVCELW